MAAWLDSPAACNKTVKIFLDITYQCAIKVLISDMCGGY